MLHDTDPPGCAGARPRSAMSSSRGRLRGGYDDRGIGGGTGLGDAAYQGRMGATRLEPVHVVLDDGRVRTVSVHVGVNVGSDPHLREAALAGALHRFEGGEELAVSFVFHDPIQRKLCIVVPTALRHQALSEQAKLLASIAEDREVPVPPYVREAVAVIGPQGLRSFLEKAVADAQAAESLRGERDLLEAQRTALDIERGSLERERGEQRRQLESFEREREGLERQRQALGQESAGQSSTLASLEAERAAVERTRLELERERVQLDQREQRVRERAEAVTSREDELREESERYEAQARDIAMREQELEQRLESLVQREQAVRRDPMRSESRGSERPPERPKTIPPPSSGLPASKLAFKPTLSPPTSPIAEPVEQDDDVEELDDLEPIRTNPGRVAGAGEAREGTSEESRPSRPDADEEAVEEIVDEEDVAEEVEPLDGELGGLEAEELGADEVREEITGVHQDGAREESGPRTAIATMDSIHGAGRELEASTTGATARMPIELEDQEMIAESGDGVDLFVRLPEHIDGLGELDLLVRLSTEEGPTAILELVGSAAGKSITRRAALDLRNAEDRGVLDQLRRRFEAHVRFFSHDGRPFDEADVAAPREVNAARVVDRGVRLKTELGGAAAKARALSRPVTAPEPHPFEAEGTEKGPAETGEITAASVLSTLGPLADALAPERLDHALTVLSVPRDQIDAAVARSIERAINHGLALPTALVERALASAIVPDGAALVVRQIDAFRGTVLRPDRGHLDEPQIASNWERLLKNAADNEVALDSETHDLAFRAIRAVKGDDTGSHDAAIDPTTFGDLAPPQLVMMLEHPRYRRAAAVALAEKKDPAFADVLSKAVRKMPRHEVVRVMPKLVALGEEAGDALIDGLSARKTFVRQGFALVLGHLKLRRAVVPLLHRLGAEESPVHRELARVIGSFGNASFRPFARQLADAKNDDARLTRTLAHLAIAGCEKQVEELKKDGDARIKELATNALQMVPEARLQEEVVMGKRALDESDAILAFSRRFEEELRGAAPDTDLAAAPGEE